MKLVEVLALHLHAPPGPGRAEGGGPSPLELLDRLQGGGAQGKVVVGDAGYLYPELAGKVVQRGRTSLS